MPGAEKTKKVEPGKAAACDAADRHVNGMRSSDGSRRDYNHEKELERMLTLERDVSSTLRAENDMLKRDAKFMALQQRHCEAVPPAVTV